MYHRVRKGVVKSKRLVSSMANIAREKGKRGRYRVNIKDTVDEQDREEKRPNL